MKKVLTITPKMLASDCRRLEAMCPPPDLVVGVANGGVHVSKHIFSDVKHIVIRRQRASTQRKQGSGVKKILRRLPYPVLDLMRIVESWVLRLKEPGLSDVPLDADVLEALCGCGKILIVDDAVDSGATLASVVEAVRSAAPDAEISTAALTLTSKRPLLYPDYKLYTDVLLRFPWSTDYKEKSL